VTSARPARQPARPSAPGIRLVVVDDNPHLAWRGRVHPVNATFHRFLAEVLDLPERPVATVVHIVPLRDALGPPHSLPLDDRIDVVGSAPFDGIAGYLRHARAIRNRNRRIFEREIELADLVWLKVPASNALLAGRAAERLGRPRFGWVAGSARQVATALPRNRVFRLGAAAVGAAYDVSGRLASGPHRIVVGKDVVEGGGIVASLVQPAELRDASTVEWTPQRPIRLAWAGRIAHGKGIRSLLELLAALPDVELVMLGEGPARTRLEAEARRLGVERRIDWRGFVAEREPYLETLASADILVHPSTAEGFPKVVLDAMAVGLPVAAAPAGGLAELARARLIAPIGRRGPAQPAAAAVMGLLRDPRRTQEMRERAGRFATEHTAPAEARRLVERLRGWFPDLPWGRDTVGAGAERSAAGSGSRA
jgi:glycosyltransferase involved in cell wall biosynthesis